jgi:MoaA/NifB/PqqE/SkfB family radical SAM enzyme
MIRIFNSKDYKWKFDLETGQFNRWGRTTVDDPDFSPIGPEILDIEVSTICHRVCNFCYKSNAVIGKNMSFETFKIIFDKVKGNLTQVAFGVGDLNANMDLKKMMIYCREHNVIPNITFNGSFLNEDWSTFLAGICGAVSVSNYNKPICYSAIKTLTDKGLKQANIHQLLSKETLIPVYKLLYDIQNDARLENLNAVVFLSLKQRGRGVSYHPITTPEFDNLVDILLENGIRFGFDSCTANKFMDYIKKNPRWCELEEYVEPCESGLFSAYINVKGAFYPCSFTENNEGISVVDCKDFLQDVWYNPSVVLWRNILLDGGRNCPAYTI